MNNHVLVNPENGLINQVGDSLHDINQGPGCSTKIVNCLQSWLKNAFGEYFKNNRNSLAHAIQNDMFSCGIIATNTIEHAIFNRPLIDPAHASQSRLSWFCRLASQIVTSKSAATTHLANSGPAHIHPLVIPKQQQSSLTHLLNPVNIPPFSSLLCDFDSENAPSSESSEDSVSESEIEADEKADSLPPSEPMDINDSPTQVSSGNKASNSKRLRISSDDESDNNSDMSTRPSQKYIKAGEGKSKSSIAARNQRQKVKDGTFILDVKKYRRWQEMILEDDVEAEFDEKDYRRVRHSACGTYLTMKEPYDATRWRIHLKGCGVKRKKAASHTPSLFKMGFFTHKKPPASASQLKIPCPGITEADTSKVRNYLKRTAALGGGGKSLPDIAKKLFNKCFSKLKSDKKRQRVIDTQMHEWKWRNDHENTRVFSVSCEHEVQDHSPLRPLPCHECKNVLQSKAFKNIISKPIPKTKDYIYVNHRFRNPVLGELYASTIGLKDLIENQVRCISFFLFLHF